MRVLSWSTMCSRFMIAPKPKGVSARSSEYYTRVDVTKSEIRLNQDIELWWARRLAHHSIRSNAIAHGGVQIFTVERRVQEPISQLQHARNELERAARRQGVTPDRLRRVEPGERFAPALQCVGPTSNFVRIGLGGRQMSTDGVDAARVHVRRR